jgi:ketosteroid isomerase-like protein
MTKQQETRAIHDFINAFGEALSMPDHNKICSFYAVDGLFFPNNYPTLGRDQLDKAKGTFLKNRRFKIEFKIGEIVIKENTAFVQAIAQATTTELVDNLSFTVASRDLFVLCKDNSTWKIHCYMFNDFNNDQSARWETVSPSR